MSTTPPLLLPHPKLDRGHAKYHRIKKHRVETRGDKTVRVLEDGMNPGVPGGGEAGKE